MLHEDEDDKDEAPTDTAALRRRRIVNMHTGAMLWIQLLSFEEYDNFLADANCYRLRSTTISSLTPRGSFFSTMCAPKQCASSSTETGGGWCQASRGETTSGGNESGGRGRGIGTGTGSGRGAVLNRRK
jgi:hypothetical protein